MLTITPPSTLKSHHISQMTDAAPQVFSFDPEIASSNPDRGSNSLFLRFVFLLLLVVSGYHILGVGDGT